MQGGYQWLPGMPQCLCSGQFINGYTLHHCDSVSLSVYYATEYISYNRQAKRSSECTVVHMYISSNDDR